MTIKLLGTVLLATALASCASSSPSPSQQTPTSNDRPANWRSLPAADLFLRAYPQRAWDEGVGSKVMLDCTIGTDGHLHDCTVVSESPAGWGFGEATLKLTPYFLFTPAQKDGLPVVTLHSKFPIAWNASR
jgi:TonB family protein